jgi:hypothetical protein
MLALSGDSGDPSAATREHSVEGIRPQMRVKSLWVKRLAGASSVVYPCMAVMGIVAVTA